MPLVVNNIAAPTLPIPAIEYTQNGEEGFRSVIRLFFTQLVETINQGTVGGTDIQIETGAARTITASDENSLISFTSGSPVTVTLPVGASEDLTIGFNVRLDRDGAGTLTVAGETGTTINSAVGLSARAQYSTLHVIKTDINVYKISGDGV